MVLDHLPLVASLARRYAQRGEPLEDLIQVGTEGLIKAVDRFDQRRGTSLVAFATPTIVGEIRRHFRDRLRVVHVPRGLQEAGAKLNGAVDNLTGELGRVPTVKEIAKETNLSEEEVLDAIAARSAFRPVSLSRTPTSSDDEPAIDFGSIDPEFERAEARVVLASKLGTLPERERHILALRFGQGLTQSEIAAQVGVSQMHVSRLVRQSILTLRRALGTDDDLD